jgi:hypothetical protein
LNRILLFFLLAFSAFGQAEFHNATLYNWSTEATVTPPAPSLLLEANFEETGTPTGWTASGIYDFDNTEQVGQGSQAVKASAVLVDSTIISTAFTAGTTRYFYFMFYAGNLPPGNETIFGIRDGTTSRQIVYLAYNGKLLISNGASGGTADGIVAGAWYHVWVTYAASGTCSVEFSADGTRMGSGNNFVSITGTASSAVDHCRVQASYVTSTPSTNWFDRVLVSTAQIGNNL